MAVKPCTVSQPRGEGLSLHNGDFRVWQIPFVSLRNSMQDLNHVDALGRRRPAVYLTSCPVDTQPSADPGATLEPLEGPPGPPGF